MPSVTSSAVVSTVMTIVASVDIDKRRTYGPSGKLAKRIVTHGLREAPRTFCGYPQASEVSEILVIVEGGKEPQARGKLSRGDWVCGRGRATPLPELRRHRPLQHPRAAVRASPCRPRARAASASVAGVNRWREQQRKKEREGDRDECDCRKIEYGVDGEHGQQDGYLHDPAIDHS